MKGRQVTIKDIARQLGISPSTVSRALKDHPDISNETKKAVTELAQKLKYQPNVLALSLQSAKSNTIGVIIPEIVHFFFSSVISGIEDVAQKEGFTVMICQSNESYEREVSNAQALFAHRVDGVLVSISKETTNYDHLNFFLENEIPLGFFDRKGRDIEADAVLINDFQSAYIATSHLIETGHRRIAHLTGPLTLTICSERLRVYCKALEDHEIEVDKELIVNADNMEMGAVQIKDLLSHPVPPDAIFAVNDNTAVGAMRAIIEAGLRVPEDIAVVGFSDGRIARLTTPTLTSVDQKGFEMGKEAAKLLIERIQHSQIEIPPRLKVLDGELIIRESSTTKNKKN